MHEIVYLSFGNRSAYQTVHFFNAQESYFTFGASEEDPPVLHDVSWREGRGWDGSETYMPRLLLFDLKANIGAMKRVNDMYDPTGAEPISMDVDPYSGAPLETLLARPPIPASSYQDALETAADPSAISPPEAVRTWSDFNRTFFHPRTLQQIPCWQPAGSGTGLGFDGWNLGEEVLVEYEKETSVMEEDFRSFVEECDLLQGFQISADVSDAFSGLSTSFLSHLRDEHPKASMLTFTQYAPRIEGLSADVQAMNESLALQKLEDLSSIVVPLRPGEEWKAGEWSKGMRANFKDLYHTSAILNAHIESATLPFRLRNDPIHLPTVANRLNWRGGNKIASLSGALPLPLPLTADTLRQRMFDFSKWELPSAKEDREDTPFAESNVIRTEMPLAKTQADETLKPLTRLREPLLSRTLVSLPYPLPSSHPAIFPYSTAPLPIFSSLSSSTAPRHIVKHFASLLGSPALRYGVRAGGPGKDDVREAEEALWTVWSGYTDEDDAGEFGLAAESDGEMDEDED